LNEQLNKLPPHNGLGNIVMDEPDEEGDISFYRPCLYRWSEEAQKEYEAENDKANFGWCVTGANPVWGVYAWIVGDEVEL
tara:strand:+ start:2762 stop:3001 length:240 start_codon:yes stop_codon:yes gene_type:complete